MILTLLISILLFYVIIAYLVMLGIFIGSSIYSYWEFIPRIEKVKVICVTIFFPILAPIIAGFFIGEDIAGPDGEDD